MDFEPIVLDDAGLDNQIYLQEETNSNLEDSTVNNAHGSSRDKVKHWYEARYGQNATFETHRENHDKFPIVQQEEFNL